MADSFDHCEALVRAGDKDRFLATLFAPERARRGLFALYAFNLEITRIRELAREPLPGEIRLQWWRDVFSAAGGAGDVRGHPVAAALSDTIVRYRLPLRAFADLVDAHAFDLYDEPMETLEEFEDYASKTSSALILLATLILDERRTAGIGTLAGHAGIAYATAGLLASFAQHVVRGQLYVPLEVLRRHGARPEDIFAGKPSLELRAALAEMRLRARRHLGDAKAMLASARPAAAPAFLPAALTRALLARMEQRGYDPFRPFEFPQWRRQWTLWRAARKPVRIFG